MGQQISFITELPQLPQAWHPLIHTPFTNVGTPDSCQAIKICDVIEDQLTDCLTAYGAQEQGGKCYPYLQDLRECTHHMVSTERVFAMQAERERQYKAGERTKENRYGPSPRMDAFPFRF